MSEFRNRGALPHRTIKPRPEEPLANSITDLFIPLLYADAKIVGPDHVALRCPTCGYPFVNVSGIAVAKRDGYEERERFAVTEWRDRISPELSSVPINENVKGDSVLIEMVCEGAEHKSVLELGSHKGLTSVRVSRL